MKKILKAFTLIELLIVIVIISILAVALIPRLTGSLGMARDKTRLADLRQIQNALEFYANEHNGQYPVTTTGGRLFQGLCGVFNPGNIFTSYGASGRISNLSPNYLSILPSDPKGGNNCYVYRSNGVDYMLLANQTVEGIVPDEYKRPAALSHKTFAIYTSGGKMW